MADTGLFYMVMEAEGDDMLQPFDAGGAEAPPDTSTADPQADTGSNDPPPLEDTGGDDALSFPGDGDDGGGQSEDASEGDDGNDNAEDNKEDEQLSEKANNVLNKELYDKFIARNGEIEEILENLQTVSSVLPYKTVKEIDEAVTKLKSALQAGQNYVIEKFVDAQYGENLLYFKKVDALYTLLMNKINSKLKQTENDQSN